MALDTGGVVLQFVDAQEAQAVTPPPTLDYGPDLGAALQAIRQHKGISLQHVADLTRVRFGYLQALEEMRLGDLPARPFTLGYVRAYAQALGQDPDAAVSRFKLSSPDMEEPLAAPVGVRDQRDPRLALVIGVGLVILAAIGVWNVAQRVTAREDLPAETVATPAAPATAALPAAAAPNGVVDLGAPLPPPTEATTPAPYVTPGLAAASAAAAGQPAPATAPLTAASVPIGQPFRARGEVYGVAPSDAAVTLQATRGGVSLVARRGDGSPAFAQVLNAGEAYRAPAEPGWNIEVSHPEAIQVYVGGLSTGPMSAPLLPVSRLAGSQPAPAARAPAQAPAPAAPAPAAAPVAAAGPAAPQ